MADIDTKVLYLETPPTSAPKTSYILGVRVRNTGIHARAASGYVQVFDKDTGMLVKTYPVASAEIDPGEEKQAFAAEAWNLTDELVGKQFILAGMVTCDGDMIPENDILHPTTVTVAETPPEPPPAVTPHKNQHEDGGNDELDVTALHGVLHDDQPPAAHGSGKHDDTVPTLVDGLVPVEQLPDMPVAEHGSLDHDDSVEATERKDQPGGYPGLDTVGLVALEHLALDPAATDFLRGDQTWQPVTGTTPGPADLDVPGNPPADGISTDFARADHRHNGEGGLGSFYYIDIPIGVEQEVAAGVIAPLTFIDVTPFGVATFKVGLHITDVIPGDTANLYARLYAFDASGPTGIPRLTLHAFVTGDVEGELHGFITAQVLLTPYTVRASGLLVIDSGRELGSIARPRMEETTTPINRAVTNRVDMTLQLVPVTGTMRVDNAHGLVELAHIRAPG